MSELTVAEFGTLHYGCRGEIKAVLFNDGPETAPFMVSIDMEGNRGVRAGSAAGTDKKGGKEQLPFEVCITERLLVRWKRGLSYLSPFLSFSLPLPLPPPSSLCLSSSLSG